jgi:hypothetical protein
MSVWGLKGRGVNGEHMADFQPNVLVIFLLMVGVVISLLLHWVEGLLCI